MTHGNVRRATIRRPLRSSADWCAIHASPCTSPPTYSPWLSLVERWFAELTTKWIKRSAHRSVRDLVAPIRTWIADWNDEPKPYVWHQSADEILDSLAAYCQRINDSGH